MKSSETLIFFNFNHMSAIGLHWSWTHRNFPQEIHLGQDLPVQDLTVQDLPVQDLPVQDLPAGCII